MRKVLQACGGLSVVIVAWAGGCSDDAASPPAATPASLPITIAFMRHDNPNFRKADDDFFAEYVAAHPNVMVKDTTIDFGTLVSRLIAELRHDQFMFDLVLVPPSRVCGFAENLAEVPADVISLPDAQNTFFGAPLAGSTCAGKLKALPVEYNLEYGGVVVNTDKYQTKFPGKTPSWPDWDSFIADASALSEYDANGKPMAAGLDPSARRELFLSGILQRGGQYWAPGGDAYDFSTQAAHDSLAAMVDWYLKYKVMFLSLIPDKNTGTTTRLAHGATGYGWGDPAMPLEIMGYLGSYGVPSTIAELPPGSPWHFDYFPTPPLYGTEHKFVQDSGWALAVPRTSQNQKVAWDMAKALALSPAAMKRWNATTNTLPALRANGTAAAAMSDPLLAKVQPLLERGQWMGFVPVAAIDTVYGAIKANLYAVINGTATVDQALMTMQATANAALAQHKGD
jgi:multiple sugar transport system substrate-binding protein